jgi:hypothetical protein
MGEIEETIKEAIERAEESSINLMHGHTIKQKAQSRT